MYLKYKDTFCFDQNESIEIEKKLKSEIEEMFKSYLLQYVIDEECSEEIK